MNWWPVIGSLINRIPFERVLFPPRDNAKALQDFATDLSEHQSQNKPPSEGKTTIATQEPPLQQPVASASPVVTGTACIPCSRDHLSVTSSALSEGIRFARDKGVKDTEVIRRIRIALDELNAMERIDLAPDEIIKLKGAEKELADWTLRQSRELRHAITAIRDVDTMEQAAARASQITEEFMSRLWEIPEEECETCEQVRESIKEFIEKRKRERAGI
ncbi:hypothetical protein ES703_64704 [subsurface metagenome]